MTLTVRGEPRYRVVVRGVAAAGAFGVEAAVALRDVRHRRRQAQVKRDHVVAGSEAHRSASPRPSPVTRPILDPDVQRVRRGAGEAERVPREALARDEPPALPCP